jgi:membrane protease YdiL (CAAX protease family)
VTRTIEIEQPRDAGRGPLGLIRRHPLISFFVIAYAFTWTYDLLFLVFFPVPDIPGRSTPRDFGPSVAALVVTAVISGKSGLRRFFQRFLVWRVNPIWYLFIFVGVPLIYTAGIALEPGALSSFKTPSLTGLLLLPVLFLYIVVLGGPLFEEPGWRGFALPRLQRRWAPLAAAVVLGVLWATWHATEYLEPEFARANGGLTLSGVVVFLLAAVCFSIIIAWVFNHTGGSILIAILLHGSINFSQGLTSDLFPKGGFNEVGPVAAFCVTALIIVVATRGRLGYSRTDDRGDLADHPTAAAAQARNTDG